MIPVSNCMHADPGECARDAVHPRRQGSVMDLRMDAVAVGRPYMQAAIESPLSIGTSLNTKGIFTGHK
jgi:hypothetical protein